MKPSDSAVDMNFSYTITSSNITSDNYLPTRKQLGKVLMFNLRSRCKIDSIDHEIGAFNLSFGKFYEHIDKKTLDQAIHEIIKRHQNLRTVFVDVNNEIRQRILKPEAIKFKVDFFNVSSSPSQENTAQAIVRDLAGYKFDFYHEIPIKVALIKIAERRFLVACTINHIACDLHSLQILQTEIEHIYLSLATHKIPALSPLKIHIADFAQWESKLLAQRSSDSHYHFWTTYLSEPVPLFILKDYFISQQTTDPSYVQALTQEMNKNFEHVSGEEIKKLFGLVHRANSFDGASYRFTIGPLILNELKKRSVEWLCSISSICVTNTLILLNRLTSKTDLIVGIETATRNISHIHDVVGWLTNTLFLRKTISPELSPQQCIQETHNQILEILKYQAYPFEQILFDIDKSLDAVGAAYTNYTNHSQLALSNFETVHTADKDDKPYFDLDIFFSEYSNGIEIKIRYKTEVFQEKQISNFANTLKGIFEEVSGTIPRKI